MLNQKLKVIANLINPQDKVIDIGCDHAYLAIYLKENNLCKEVYASDISESVIQIARKNVEKSKTNINVYHSDGFKNINLDINTAIISGMGTNTILNIIKDAPSSITKYIVSSNNKHFLLRKKMLKKNFFIKKEIIVIENNKYYPIMLFTKNKEKENKLTLKYGKSKNKEYFNYLLNKEILILKNIPKNKIITKIKHKKNIYELTKLLKKL